MRVPGRGSLLGSVSPSGGETVNSRLPTTKAHQQDCDKDRCATEVPPNVEPQGARVSGRVMETLKRLITLAAQKRNQDPLAELFHDFELLSVDDGRPRHPRDDAEEPPLTATSVQQLRRLIHRLATLDKTTEGRPSAASVKTALAEGDGSDDDNDNDVCSRAPARRYHSGHVDASPYSNASHRHHSGGACTFAAIDPSPVGEYENIRFTPLPTACHPLSQFQNVVDDSEALFDITEADIKILNSMPYKDIVNIVNDMYNEYCRAEETSEVPPCETSESYADLGIVSSSLVADSWSAYDSGISSSSSSPVSMPASSPAGSHGYSPQSSPPDDSNHAVPCPDLRDQFSECATLYSPHQDFETLDQMASNNYMCGLDPSADVDGLDEGFGEETNVFAVSPRAFRSPTPDPPCASDAVSPRAFRYPAPDPHRDAAAPTLALLYPVVPAPRRAPVASPGPKPIRPKIDRPAETAPGRERLQKMLDEKKKADAWSTVFSLRKEAMDCDKDGDTQLLILCADPAKAGDSALEYIYALVEMLKNIPEALSTVNKQNHSALYLAAVHSDYEHSAVVVRYLAETLLEQGVDITQPSASGSNLLHQLCSLGDKRHDVIKELLALRDSAGRRCFDVDAFNARGKTPLHLAASHIPLPGSSCGKTIQLLVAEGANILLTDKWYGNTALHFAILNSCSTSLVQALLSAAKTFCPPGDLAQICNAQDRYKNTPLHSAASRNDVPLEQQKLMIKMLTDQAHKAHKSMNAHGKYPILLVAEERRQEIRAVYESRREN